MKIGELARESGASVETIRFYEREQLLQAPARSEGNYRIYGVEHTERLAFVRHCRSLDMALDEIRVLLRFTDSPRENCAGVNELLDEHIGHVAKRIQELRGLKKQLKLLREQCGEAAAASECGILKELPGSPNSVKSSPHRSRHVRGAH